MKLKKKGSSKKKISGVKNVSTGKSAKQIPSASKEKKSKQYSPKESKAPKETIPPYVPREERVAPRSTGGRKTCVECKTPFTKIPQGVVVNQCKRCFFKQFGEIYQARYKNDWRVWEESMRKIGEALKANKDYHGANVRMYLLDGPGTENATQPGGLY